MIEGIPQPLFTDWVTHHERAPIEQLSRYFWWEDEAWRYDVIGAERKMNEAMAQKGRGPFRIEKVGDQYHAFEDKR